MLNEAEVRRHAQPVLIAEDDFLQREQIAEALRRIGIPVVTAANGFAAMHELRRSRPSVVVLDINMPGLDGLDVARLIQRRHRRPTLILISAYVEHLSRAHQEDLGVFAIVEKPIHFPLLVRFVREARGEELDGDPSLTGG